MPMQMQLVICPNVPLLLVKRIKLQERLANAKPTVNAPKSISQVSQLKARQRLNCGIVDFFLVASLSQQSSQAIISESECRMLMNAVFCSCQLPDLIAENATSNTLLVPGSGCRATVCTVQTDPRRKPTSDCYECETYTVYS